MALEAAPYLRFSISLDDVANGKPNPEPYAQAAARLGVAPSRLLAVEDSWTGLASARGAGLRTAAIAGDLDLEADWQIDGLMEVVDIVLSGRRFAPEHLPQQPAR